MTGTVYEIGMRSNIPLDNSSQWSWDLSAYYAPISDEILSVDDPTRPGDSLSANIDKTTHAGIEVLTGASFAFGQGFSHRIEAVVSLTWNDFHFDSDRFYGDNSLPAAPDYVVRGEVLYRNSNGMYAGPTFDLVGQRYADFSTTYEVDASSSLSDLGRICCGDGAAVHTRTLSCAVTVAELACAEAKGKLRQPVAAENQLTSSR